MSGPEDRRLVATTLSEVRPEPVRWFWERRVPLGSLTILAGKPKFGKSTVALHLAARASKGTLEGDLEGQPANVLVVTYEDHVAATIVPRLIAAGADLERVAVLEAEQDGDRDLVSLPTDVDALECAVVDHGARLLVIDPLVAALTGETDSHRDAHIRRVLAPLAKLAERCDLAVLVIVHLNKRQGLDLIDRVGGSVGITGAARSLLLFGADPSDPEGEEGHRRVLVQRGNLAEPAPGLAYRLEGRTIVDDEGGTIETSRLEPLGETDARADELLAELPDADERSAREDAADWLADRLDGGDWHEGQQVKADALKHGHRPRTLERAAGAVGVERRREGFQGRSYWRLPVAPGGVGATGDGATGETAETRIPEPDPQGAPSQSRQSTNTGATGAETRLVEASTEVLSPSPADENGQPATAAEEAELERARAKQAAWEQLRCDAARQALGDNFEPAPAPTCECDQPSWGVADEDGDPRCGRCGRQPKVAR